MKLLMFKLSHVLMIFLGGGVANSLRHLNTRICSCIKRDVCLTIFIYTHRYTDYSSSLVMYVCKLLCKYK